jgi:hypothetical protein
MKSSALIPFVVVVAAYSAQAAVQRRPTEPPVSHFRGTCESDPDGKKFAAKACYTSYYPPGEKGYYRGYTPPTCDPKQEVTNQQREVLAKVYSRAPDYMKGKLCRLTQLFVTGSTMEGPMGWGFWEGPDRSAALGVYLAVSASELETKNSVVEAENQTVDMLLQVSARPKGKGRMGKGRMGKGAGLVGLRSADPADPELTVLAGLAHELGHALVADTNTDGFDENHPRREVSGPPQSKCFADAFIGASWDAERFRKSMRRWVDFGMQYGNRQKNPDVRYSLSRLRELVRQGKFDEVNAVLRNVYRSGEFVSMDGSVSPWEDAVETFKYKVLADVMPNQSIVFPLGDQEVNVLDLLKSDIVAKKLDCLRELGFFTGQP